MSVAVETMKDFRVHVRVKNNRLLTAIENAGFESARALIRAMGMKDSSVIQVYELLSMKLAPINGKTGEWRSIVVRMCEVLRKMPDDLFPEELQRVGLSRNSAQFEMDSDELAALLPAPDARQYDPERMLESLEERAVLDGLLDTLTPREAEVLRRHFGLDDEASLEELAKEQDVTRERIRQIEAKALRKMRHPSRTEPLALAYGIARDELPDKSDGEWTIHGGVKDEPEPKPDDLPKTEEETLVTLVVQDRDQRRLLEVRASSNPDKLLGWIDGALVNGIKGLSLAAVRINDHEYMAIKSDFETFHDLMDIAGFLPNVKTA